MNMLLRLPAPIRRRPGRAVAIAAVAAVVVALAPAAAGLASTGQASVKPSGTQAKEALPNFDIRSDGNARKVLAARSADIAAHPTAGVRALRQQLGIQGIVDVDSLTRTARRVAKLNGFLTGASTKSPTTIALNFVRSHADVFGLSSAQVSSLTLRQDYVDVAGTHHLSFVQSVGGVPVFGNGVKAHVTQDGRLIQVDGAPVANLPASIGVSGLTAAQARSKAVADTFGDSAASVLRAAQTADKATDFTGGDKASLVVFQTLSGPRLAWQVLTMKEGYLHVIDAQTGRTLYRF